MLSLGAKFRVMCLYHGCRIWEQISHHTALKRLVPSDLDFCRRPKPKAHLQPRNLSCRNRTLRSYQLEYLGCSQVAYNVEFLKSVTTVGFTPMSPPQLDLICGLRFYILITTLGQRKSIPKPPGYLIGHRVTIELQCIKSTFFFFIVSLLKSWPIQPHSKYFNSVTAISISCSVCHV